MGAIDKSAGHRHAIFPRVSENRRRETLAVAQILVRESLKAFIHIPPVISPAFHDIHFFKQILPHIADPQLVGQRIKTKPPGLAKSIRPNLRSNSSAAEEWI